MVAPRATLLFAVATLMTGFVVAQTATDAGAGSGTAAATSDGAAASSTGDSDAANYQFDPNLIDNTLKNEWCRSQSNNCPTLCGGPTQIKENRCVGESLTYTCTCANGSAPANIDQYLDTLPNNICQATFAQCRTKFPGSDSCKECGTLKPSDVQAVAASTSAAMSTSAAATSAPPSASPSAAPAGGNWAGRIEVGVLQTLLLVGAVGVGVFAL